MITKEELALRTRYEHLMCRHLRPEDAALTDRDLVLKAHSRWLLDQAAPLIDPAE